MKLGYYPQILRKVLQYDEFLIEEDTIIIQENTSPMMFGV